MTPLASKCARDLTLPVKQRGFDDRAGILTLFDQEMHTFDVTAIAKSVNEAMDQDNLWPEIENMLPVMFLPSPVTWLEMMIGNARIALTLRDVGDGFEMASVHDSVKGPFSLPLCTFRASSVLDVQGRIHIDPAPLNMLSADNDFDVLAAIGFDENDIDKWKNDEGRRRLYAASEIANMRRDRVARELEVMESNSETVKLCRRFIGSAVLTIDLLNTPGLVGLRQHQPHRALARDLRKIGVGRYPLQSWSEVVLKAHTTIADDDEHLSGVGFHKCLHFVRSHERRYRTGHVARIPAHWRGDPALGIKRTRYRLAA